MNYLILIIFTAAIVSLFYFLISSISKTSKNDWQTLYDLEAKASKVESLEEVKALHAEFRIRANKIHNQYITPRLMRIDGYLRGLTKTLEK